MNAFYSIWTAPGENGTDRAFMMQDYDLACLLLSVAAYERYNGKTRLYADAVATEYFRMRGLDRIFSRGMGELEVPEGIDPRIFWAAGKLCALKKEEMPSVMLDTDLIVWQGIGRELKDCSLAVIHREELNPEVYPSPEVFSMKEGYSFPQTWDFQVLPVNTALLYIRDKSFRDHYVEESLRFMRYMGETKDRLCPMVFAEQRILPMCAQARGLHVFAFCSHMEELREQHRFTHLWGHKNVLKYNMDERRAFLRRCLGRMKREFPDMYEVAAGLPEFYDVKS